MKKWWVVGIIAVVVVVGELGYFFFLKNKQKKTSSVIPVQQITKPADFKVISQAEGDTEGRTVVYQTSTKGTFPGYTGTNYLVGYFVKLELIENSSDYYLYLTTDNNGQQGQEKIRLLIIPIPFEQYKNPHNTSFGVENMEKVHKEGILPINDIPSDKLSNLFKNGDVVVVTFFTNETEVVKDKAGYKTAKLILIRRYLGKLSYDYLVK